MSKIQSNLFVKGMENDQNVRLTDYQFRDKKVFGWSCSQLLNISSYFANFIYNGSAISLSTAN